jgi:hypothetical protein
VQKMITIGSVGSAPHMREIYSYPRNACSPMFFFFILPDPYSPNGNSHLDHNASIDADFLKEVPFGVSRFQKILWVIFAPETLKKFLTAAKA